MIDDNKLTKLLPELKGTELKILIYLSNGYSYALSKGCDCFTASYNQIRKYTGIKSDESVFKSIKKLIKKDLITQETEWINGKCKSVSKFTSSLVIIKEESTTKNTVLEDNEKKKSSSSTTKNTVLEDNENKNCSSSTTKNTVESTTKNVLNISNKEKECKNNNIINRYITLSHQFDWSRFNTIFKNLTDRNVFIDEVKQIKEAIYQTYPKEKCDSVWQNILQEVNKVKDKCEWISNNNPNWTIQSRVCEDLPL